MTETQTDSANPQEAQTGLEGLEFKGSFSTGKQTEEAPKEDAKTETEVTDSISETTDNQEVTTDTTEQPQSSEANVTDEATQEAPTEAQIEQWKALAEKAGIEAGSEDEIVNYLKQFGSIKESLPDLQQKAKYYESLDPLILDLDKAKKAGIDENLYLKARNLDTEKLGDDDSLWMQFELQNAQLIKDDPTFARMKFEKEQKAKYGLLNEKLDEEEAEEQRDEIEFQKRSKLADAQSAKRFLQDWKRENVTIPESQQTPPTEVLDQIRTEYFKQADEFIEATSTLDIPLDEQNVFKYGLDGVKDKLSHDVKNPLEAIKRHGIDLEQGTIDAKKFGELMAIYHAFKGFSKPFSDYVLEKRNKDTVAGKVKPAPPQSQVGGALPEKTHSQKLAEAFELQRKAEASANY